MANRTRDLGALWHALAGLGLGALGSYFLGLWGLAVVGGVGLVGYLREVRQHDWYLNLHQTLEAAAWTVGSSIGWLIGYLVVRFS